MSSNIYDKEQKKLIPFAGNSHLALVGLDDVAISSLSAGQALVYDATTQKWINGEGATKAIISGYYNASDGKFYEESTYTTEIEGNVDNLYVSLDKNTIYRYDEANTAFVLVGISDVVEYVDTLPVSPNIENKIYGTVSKETISLTFGDLIETDVVEWDEDEQAYLPTRGLHGLSLDIIKFAESSNPSLGAWFITGMNSVGSISTTYVPATSVVNFTTDEDIYAYYFGDSENQSLEEVVTGLELGYLTATDIDNLMRDVSEQQWSYLADIIVDTETSVSKVWSSNQIRLQLNTTLDAAKQYTDEQLSHYSSATYKMAETTADVVSRDYMYLIPVAGTTDNYEIYVLVDDLPTAIGTTQVQLSNYYTKAEADARYLRQTDAALAYVGMTKYNNEVGDVTQLSGFTATNVVGALNEINTFENTNIDFANDF